MAEAHNKDQEKIRVDSLGHRTSQLVIPEVDVANTEKDKELRKRFQERYYDAHGFISDPGDSAGEQEDMGKISKWQEMTQNWTKWTTKNAARLKTRIRKGIPNAFRTSVWGQLIDLKKYKEKYEADFDGDDYFKHMCTLEPDKAVMSVIEHDLNRTFPKHAEYQDGDGQKRLCTVLKAYACHDRELGYCQGMGFITALFLMYYEESKAFWMLVAFLENPKYNMRGVYLVGLPLLHQRYFELEYLLQTKRSKLYKKLIEFDIKPVFYASKWFMTIFCYNSDFDCVLKIWDCFLSEGIKIVYRVALSLLQSHEPALLKLNEPDEALSYLQNHASEITMEIIDSSFSISLSKKDLDKAAELYKKSLEPEEPDEG